MCGNEAIEDGEECDDGTDSASCDADCTVAECGDGYVNAAAGENILDNWSLIHACYFYHDSIQFGAQHANLRSGRSLSELTARPYMPTLWQSEAAGPALIRLIVHAKSSLIRLWAMELLRTENEDAIGKIHINDLLDLLSHSDPRVQDFATALFRNHPKVASLRVEQWLELLDRSEDAVLPEMRNELVVAAHDQDSSRAAA